MDTKKVSIEDQTQVHPYDTAVPPLKKKRYKAKRNIDKMHSGNKKWKALHELMQAKLADDRNFIFNSQNAFAFNADHGY